MLCIAHPDADLGFDQSLFESAVVGTDRLIPVSAPDANGAPIHALPGTKDAPIKYLYFSEASALGQVVDAMLARHEGPVFVKKSSSSPLAGALKSMAENGLGVTWIAEMLARIAIRDGSLVLAGDETWCIPVDIRIFRARSPLPRISESFWNLISEKGATTDPHAWSWMGLFSQTYGSDEPSLSDEAVPGGAAMVEGIPLALEDAVREPVVAG